MKDTLTYIFLLIIIIIQPIIFIWVINVLFGTAIAYTLYNWFMAAVVVTVIQLIGD